MINAFEILGIERTLTLSDDTLRAAFRGAGKSAHPDAGGGDAEFARLREAFEILGSPSKRLKHWLELRCFTVETRGVVDTALMDLFGRVGEITQRAEALIRKRGESKSALGLAMLEGETQVCRESVEKALRLVEEAMETACSVFPDIEAAETLDLDAATKTVRNLAFLEKWRAGLRSVRSRLI